MNKKEDENFYNLLKTKLAMLSKGYDLLYYYSITRRIPFEFFTEKLDNRLLNLKSIYGIYRLQFGRNNKYNICAKTKDELRQKCIDMFVSGRLEVSFEFEIWIDKFVKDVKSVTNFAKEYFDDKYGKQDLFQPKFNRVYFGNKNAK